MARDSGVVFHTREITPHAIHVYPPAPLLIVFFFQWTPYSIWSVHHDVLLSHMAPPIWPDGRKPPRSQARTHTCPSMHGWNGGFYPLAWSASSVRSVSVVVVLFLFHSMTTRAATGDLRPFSETAGCKRVGSRSKAACTRVDLVRACKDRRWLYTPGCAVLVVVVGAPRSFHFHTLVGVPALAVQNACTSPTNVDQSYCHVVAADDSCFRCAVYLARLQQSFVSPSDQLRTHVFGVC
jgi:hypothetical protein